SRPAATRRRPAKARRQGLRLRARAAVRPLPAHRVSPPQGPPTGRHRRLGARGALGLLLRHPRRAKGAIHMAELTTTPEQVREAVREKYAAAALATESGSECGCGCCSPADDAGVFGASLYAETDADVPAAAINASLGCGVPTAVADLHEGEVVLDLGSG